MTSGSRIAVGGDERRGVPDVKADREPLVRGAVGRFLIVIAKLGDEERVAFDLVDQAVLVINTTRPISRQTVLERLGLTDTGERRTLNVPNEVVNSPEGFAIGPLPVEVILPSVLGEDQPHSRSSCSTPPPACRSATASSSRRAFFGLRRR